MRLYGIFLSAEKSDLFSTKISWCGKIYTAGGVHHSPSRIQALASMPLPTTADALQQFLCAANWMRSSIPDFSRHMQPLNDMLLSAFDSIKAKKKTKKIASKIYLAFTKDQTTAFNKAKEAIMSATLLAYPDDQALRCVFTDASNLGWAAIITQIPISQAEEPLQNQNHQPLAFMSGMFRGAALNWAIIDKEAYPIIHVITHARHFLASKWPYRLYVDHKNLVHIFTSSARMTLASSNGRLDRWAVLLRDLPYVIEHVAGIDNLWADMLSRWGQAPLEQHATQSTNNSVSIIKPITAVRRIATKACMPITPLYCYEDSTWPLDTAILASQQAHKTVVKPPLAIDPSDGLIKQETRVYIPPNDKKLIMRIMVIGHFTLAGHRGQDSTLSIISRQYIWPNMQSMIYEFCSNCLHCLRAKGGRSIPRPYGNTFRATTSNEHLHFDFLWMGKSAVGPVYILALKDDLTHYCRLHPCLAADADTTAKVLFAWFADFGVAPLWTSDMGSHFVNATIAKLAELFHCKHNIVLSGCSWINGSIERLLKDVLAVTRTILAELSLDRTAWPSIVPPIQHVLNHTPVRSLGGKAPVEAFTGLPAQSPFPCLYTPNGSIIETKVTADEIAIRTEALRMSLANMHRDIIAIRESRLRENRKHQKGAITPNFTVGDYVLRADVKRKATNDKLLCSWVGPYRITACPRPYVFTLTSLVDDRTHDTHASRIKFYHDATLDITEDLKEHISVQDLSYDIEAIKCHRKNMCNTEFLVKWVGFSDDENTWEPEQRLKEDVPALVEAYFKSLPASKTHLAQQEVLKP